MLTFNDLLSTYYAFEHQKTIEISERVHALRQQLALQLLNIREEETKFIAAQQNCLELMRPTLATDARSLLATPQFEQFVRSGGATRRQSLLQPIEFKAIPPDVGQQLGQTPEDWLLKSLPFALHLWDIRLIRRC